ncbi:MAG: cupin domain-containing protein [Acidimicrobiales bacterium]
MSTPVPIIRAAGEGDKQSFFGGGLHTWKLLAEDTGGAFFLFEDVMEKGKTTPLHKHPDADETVYVLEGEIVVNVDGIETHIGPGGMSYVPKGVPHAFLVVADGTRTLCMQTPGVGQAFYRGASEPAVDGAADIVDIARLKASAEENPGVELLGPPPSFETVSVG